MIEELIASIFAFVIGTALVVWLAYLARGAIRHQKELARKRDEIASQEELEKFIRAVDRATSDEELNRLAREEKRDD